MCVICVSLSPTLGTSGVSSGHPHTLQNVVPGLKSSMLDEADLNLDGNRERDLERFEL